MQPVYSMQYCTTSVTLLELIIFLTSQISSSSLSMSWGCSHLLWVIRSIVCTALCHLIPSGKLGNGHRSLLLLWPCNVTGTSVLWSYCSRALLGGFISQLGSNPQCWIVWLCLHVRCFICSWCGREHRGYSCALYVFCTAILLRHERRIHCSY